MHIRKKLSSPVPLPGTGINNRGRDKRGGGGSPALAGTREYKQSDKVGSRRRVVMMLWNLECPVGLSQKRIRAHFTHGK